MNANTPSIQTTSGTVDAEDYQGKARYVQNVGTNPLYVRCGPGASNSVFHFALAGGTVDSDGLGGMIKISQADWAGIISVAGTSPKYVFTELS